MTKLFLTRRVKVVERSLLEKAVAELKFSASGMVDQDTAKSIGRQVGADAIITGTITDLKTSVKINARMITVETGDILAAAGVEVIQDKVITGLLAQILSRPAPSQSTSSPPTLAEEKPKEVEIPPQPSTQPVLETESYRITVESVKKSGNNLTVVMIFENLTSKILTLQMSRISSYLLADTGEKWTIPQADTASIFGWMSAPVELAPQAKRRTTVRFETKDTEEGTVFTLVLEEFHPQGNRKHAIHKIRLN